MIAPDMTPFVWWEARRARYNYCLIVAGVLAFISYAAVCWTLLPDTENVEITLFTMLFQAIGYLVVIGIANVCYFIGPLSERLIRPTKAVRYRITCYRLGLWFSILLPFSIPVLLAVLAIFYPSYWSATP